MKKAPLTILALLASILVFVGIISYLPASSATIEETQASFETYVDGEKGYSIQYPKDWQKQEIPRLDIVLVSPPKNDDENQARATMNLVSESIGEDISLEQFYNESTKHLTAELKNVKIVKSGDINIHGIPSKWIEYKHRMADSDFEVLQYFFVVKGNIFLITFSSLSDDFEHFYPTYEKIANSFTLKN